MVIAGAKRHWLEPWAYLHDVILQLSVDASPESLARLLPDRWALGYPQRTTPSSRPPSGFVTITHPHHPLRGQRVEIVRIRRGNDPDLIVVAPDGRHTAIALSSTDYSSSAESPPAMAAKHLLDLDGLRLVVQLLDRLAQAGPAPSTTGDRIQTEPSGPR